MFHVCLRLLFSLFDIFISQSMIPIHHDGIIFLVFYAIIFPLTDSLPISKRRWNKSQITWSFQDPFHFLTHHQIKTIRSLIFLAFDEWSSALDDLLIIREFNDPLSSSSNFDQDHPDISILFAKKNHSCIEAFDGRGGIVAHSTYPTGGMLHLDGDEVWHTGDATKGDVDIRYVLIHEIGHILGLRHSKKRGSVMRRNYRSSNQQTFHLSKYDIRAIRELYKKQ